MWLVANEAGEVHDATVAFDERRKHRPIRVSDLMVVRR
jgi:hypothetical protein